MVVRSFLSPGLVLVLLAAMLLTAAPASANDDLPACADLGALQVSGAFARASAGQARAAAYFAVHNGSDAADRLVSVSAVAARHVELHTHIHENGIMKMRPIEGVTIPAKGMAILKPGRDHVMFVGLKMPFRKGDLVPLTLNFERSGRCRLEVPVGPVGAAGPGSGAHAGKHGRH